VYLFPLSNNFDTVFQQESLANAQYKRVIAVRVWRKAPSEEIFSKINAIVEK